MKEKRMNKGLERTLGLLFAVAVFYRYVRWLLSSG
jgi:hypothetical protein